MSTYAIATSNSGFNGTQTALKSQAQNVVGQNISSITGAAISLSSRNSPLIGTTLRGKPPASIFQSKFPTVGGTGVDAFFNLVDDAGNLVHLPLNSNIFFTGMTFYYNLFGPGTGGAWVQPPVFLVGTGTQNPTAVNQTINGGDANLIVTLANGTTVQTLQYIPASNAAFGNAFPAFKSAIPIMNFLKKLTSATSALNNYLSIKIPGASTSVTPGTGNAIGDFTVYLNYISLF